MRKASAYLAAVFATFVTASVAHTHYALNALGETGVAIPVDLRVQTTLDDIVGLAPGYGGVIAVGLAIAFLVAWRIRRGFSVSPLIAYPLAGAAAMAALLYAMTLILSGLPLIAGARSDAGFAVQCIAGAFGGAIFAVFLPSRRAE